MRLHRAASPRRCALLTATVAACASVLLGVPPAAGAHATLARSDPAWGATLGALPARLRLVYDEPVVPGYARVTVTGGGGRNVAGTVRVVGGTVIVPLRAGQRGSYTVHWRMVASDDGHVTEGVFSFGVRAKPLPPAAAPGAGVPVAPEVLAWLQFLGVVLAGGVLTFRALVWGPAARELGDAGARDGALAIWSGVAGAVLALHAGLLGFLVGAYPIAGGGGLSAFADAEILPIRLGTHLGEAWTVTSFAWLGVLALLVGAWVTPRRREPLLAVAGIASLGIAFGISWSAHPEVHGAVALCADYLHLVAAALWAGGLVAVAGLAMAAGRLSPSRREALIRLCLVRFSTFALPVVIALALAGLDIALSEVRTLSALITTGYGITLIAKSVLALAAIGLGGYHRRVVLPRITAGAPVLSLRRTLALEGALLLGALALAAALSQSAPPR